MKKNRLINHVALVLDASSSMHQLSGKVVQVADELIQTLAKQSQDFNQETRISVYTFADEVVNAIFDMDSLRFSSLRDEYRSYGNTALIDATLLAINDLAQTCKLYGDHAFLVYVLTDGQENRSKNTPAQLRNRITNLDDTWTLAALVPDALGEQYAKNYGFVGGNINIWDATTTRGVEEVGSTISRSLTNYMTARSTGVRSTSGLFTLDATNLTSKTVKNELVKLPKTKFTVLPVVLKEEIAPFVTRELGTYVNGNAFYELTKSEEIQPQKQLIVRNKQTGDVYGGSAARDLLGLPNYHVKVKPSDYGDYDIYVQSTSYNRRLVPGTELIVLK